MRTEVERILAAIPADQLAIQWDARYEFAMLEGAIAVWFDDVRAGVVERLLRLARMVPAPSSSATTSATATTSTATSPSRRTRASSSAWPTRWRRARPPAQLDPPAGPAEREDDRYFAPLGELRLPGRDRALPRADPRGRRTARRGASPPRASTSTASGSPPSAAGAAAARPRRAGCSSCTASSARPAATAAARRSASSGRTASCACPTRTGPTRHRQAGIAYDHVDAHGWYRNLDLTVEDLAARCGDGDLLLDYSAAPGSCSTGCGCGSSIAGSAW